MLNEFRLHRDSTGRNDSRWLHEQKDSFVRPQSHLWVELLFRPKFWAQAPLSLVVEVRIRRGQQSEELE